MGFLSATVGNLSVGMQIGNFVSCHKGFHVAVSLVQYQACCLLFELRENVRLLLIKHLSMGAFSSKSVSEYIRPLHNAVV